MAVMDEPTIMEQAGVSEALERVRQAIKDKTVIRRKYISLHRLAEQDPGPHWWDEVGNCEELGVIEEQGLSLRIEGTLTGEKGRWMGQTLEPFQADALEREDDTIDVPRYLEYEVRVTQVAESDGPQECAELRQSFEQRQIAERKKQQSQGDMAGALSELTNFLKGQTGQKVDATAVTQAIIEGGLLNASQLEELALQVAEKEEAKKGKK